MMEKPLLKQAERPGLGARPALAPLMLAGAALFWAGNFVVGRALGGAAPPVSLNFWRWTLALAILVPLSIGELRSHRRAILAHWPIIGALGVTGVAAFHTLVYQALTTTTALNALLFVATAPLVIALLSWLFFRDRLRRGQALGMVLSLAGAAVVILRGDPFALGGMRFNQGDLLLVGAVLVWAAYSVLLKRRPGGLPQLALLTAMGLAGWLALLPLYLWRLAAGERLALSAPNMAALAYIALFASVLGFIFWNAGVAALGPNRAGVYINLMPVFGAVLAIGLLGERLAPYHVVGAALVALGITLANYQRRSPGPSGT
jgi:drug/metabolite transporter (DMT)-like permease